MITSISVDRDKPYDYTKLKPEPKRARDWMNL